jgi:MtrB/PioB family decaheme-associated outer membrane protein
MKTSYNSYLGALLVATLSPVGFAASGPDYNDPAVKALVEPTNVTELGVGHVGTGSAKFGEYNGLDSKGALATGTIDWRGGGAFNSDSARRWRVSGTDLGLESRKLELEYGVQGKFKLTGGYKELLHNLSDSYTTPYSGVGTGNLTLPSNWIKPIVPQVSATAVNYRALSATAGTGNSVAGAASAAQLATLAAIRAADLPAIRSVDQKTKRTAYKVGFSYLLSKQWELTGDLQREDKKGTRPIGTVASASGFESVVILPDPIDTRTASFKLGVGYTGDKSLLQLSYRGVSFANAINGMYWQDPSNTTVINHQSSAPSNNFHQLALSAVYKFSRTTRLALNGSYGRNTQNDNFMVDTRLPIGVPRTSYNGLVLTRSYNVKLTSRPLPDLSLAAEYKLDDRSDRSPVNTYVHYDINQAPTGASSFNSALGLAAGFLGSNVNIKANRPMSKQLKQYRLSGEYALGMKNSLAAELQREDIERHCYQSWIDCADAPTSLENSLRLSWRSSLTERFSTKLEVGHMKRDVDYNVNAWLAFVPMAKVIPGSPTVGATMSAYDYLRATGLSGWGPIAGFPATALSGNAAIFTPNNNIIAQSLYGSRDQAAENPGMRRYNMADRNRDLLRVSFDWGITDSFSLSGNADLNRDKYPETVYGLTDARSSMVGLDASYLWNSVLTLGAYYTRENQKGNQASWNYVGNAAAGTPSAITGAGACYADTAAKNVNNKVDPCNAWWVQSTDHADSLGLTLRRERLLGGKLALDGSVDYSKAVTDVAVQGGNYGTNPGLTTLVYIRAQNLPSVKATSVQLRLNAQYTLKKNSYLRGNYLYKKLDSVDFAYDGMQLGTVVGSLPTQELAPNYSAHVFWLSYAKTFQ